MFLKNACIIGLLLLASCSSDMDTALVINGEEIGMDQVRTAYITSTDGAIKEQRLDQAIESTINYHLMLQDAKREGIIISEDEVQREIDRILRQGGITEEQLKQILGESETSYAEYREDIRKDLMINKMLEEVFKDSDVSRSEIAEFYQDNFQAFMVPEQVIVRQIYLDSNLHTADELEDLAIIVAERLADEEFCNVAELSDEEGCKAYTIARGTVGRRYEDAAFSQDIGEISVVRSEAGVHFIQTVRKLNYNPIPLEELDDEISRSIAAAKKQKIFQEYIDGLRASAEIENYIQK